MIDYISQTLEKLQELKEADLKDIFELAKQGLIKEWDNFYNNTEYLQICETFS